MNRLMLLSLLSFYLMGLIVFLHTYFQFTLQLSLACICEYALHLTRMNPDMMYIHQDSGLVNISYYKFDINDAKCVLDPGRPVPFRLTPNISEYLSQVGASGPLTAAAIATARCWTHPTYKVYFVHFLYTPYVCSF